MGTNFYVAGHRGDDDPTFHIGKRSAAGAYCWDCGKTLCLGGEKAIHFDTHEWAKTCPSCGKGRDKDSLETSAAGRELGFNRSEPAAKTGVRSACSFMWAMDPEEVIKILERDPPYAECPTCHQPMPVLEEPFEDEYGRLYTKAQFDAMLLECPIQFYDSIGEEFS